MRSVAGRILAVIALTVLAAVPARGQTGTLTGRVMDAGSGETIANAVVRVLGGDGREIAGDLTDSDGRFELQVPAGDYEVEVTSLGFASRRIAATVTAGAGEPMSIALVVEAVEQHIEQGLSPRDATLKAMEQVSGPIVAIALILASVFLPVAFIGGIQGRLNNQFAVTIAISTLISALTP